MHSIHEHHALDPERGGGGNWSEHLHEFLLIIIHCIHLDGQRMKMLHDIILILNMRVAKKSLC